MGLEGALQVDMQDPYKDKEYHHCKKLFCASHKVPQFPEALHCRAVSLEWAGWLLNHLV